VHKEDDRQRLKQFDVALQTMATQATRKLRLAAEKFGKALAWFELELELELIQSHMAQKPVPRGELGCACVFARGATAGKLTTNVQLDSALKEEEEKSEKQKIELLNAQINIRVLGYGWTRFDTAWSNSTDKHSADALARGSPEAINSLCRSSDLAKSLRSARYPDQELRSFAVHGAATKTDAGNFMSVLGPHLTSLPEGFPKSMLISLKILPRTGTAAITARCRWRRGTAYARVQLAKLALPTLNSAPRSTEHRVKSRFHLPRRSTTWREKQLGPPKSSQR